MKEDWLEEQLQTIVNLAEMPCKRCGHRLDEHWWQEPEFNCMVDWFTDEGRLKKQEGCPCGEFRGIEWGDLMDKLGGPACPHCGK